MPRKRRFYLPGVPAHIVQRGNNRQAVFYTEQDYSAYLDWLHEAAQEYRCCIHAYVLMTNHVHLLMTPALSYSISKVILHVGRRYVMYINRKYGKSGTLWEGRHKGCIIDSDHYLLACMRYIELNPVRAGMVRCPDQYPWSSYQANALGVLNKLITPHELYVSLGENVANRHKVYRELFRIEQLDNDSLSNLRSTVQTGTPLGNDRFRYQVESVLSCKVGHSRPGRPSIKKGY